MTPGMSATYPAWSADGRLLYFASHQSGEWEIWKRSVSGGPAAQVTRHGGYISQESPDGHWLFISKVSETSLWRIPGSKFNGERPSDEELVIGPPFEVKPEAWILAGAEIIFTQRVMQPDDRTLIRAFNPATKQTRVIATLSPHFMHRNNLKLSVSPDLQWLLYSQLDKTGSNIMITESVQ